MSFELVLTSVPAGLKSGSRGFTPVALTEGMPAHFAQLLESLSGYTHHYPLHDPRYDQNPVAWSHYTFDKGGETISVLSRVSSYGKDYSGRNNKLAHHVLLKETERPDSGPAAVLSALAEEGALCTQWVDKPCHYPANRLKIASPDQPSTFLASHCEEKYGDGGLAGLLAQAYLDNPRTPSFLIYEPGEDLLPIFLEALRLIPPAQRWKVTFNTYLTNVPAGTTCNWRGCMPDSEALVVSRRMADVLVIDLTDMSVKEAPRSSEELLECARTGAIPTWMRAKRSAPKRSPMRSQSSPENPPIQAKTIDSSEPANAGPHIDYDDVLKPPPPKMAKKMSLGMKLLLCSLATALILLVAIGIIAWDRIHSHFQKDQHDSPDAPAAEQANEADDLYDADSVEGDPPDHPDDIYEEIDPEDASPAHDAPDTSTKLSFADSEIILQLSETLYSNLTRHVLEQDTQFSLEIIDDSGRRLLFDFTSESPSDNSLRFSLLSGRIERFSDLWRQYSDTIKNKGFHDMVTPIDEFVRNSWNELVITLRAIGVDADRMNELNQEEDKFTQDIKDLVDSRYYDEERVFRARDKLNARYDESLNIFRSRLHAHLAEQRSLRLRLLDNDVTLLKWPPYSHDYH